VAGIPAAASGATEAGAYREFLRRPRVFLALLLAWVLSLPFLAKWGGLAAPMC
jgi:hypothetical protein